MRKDVLLAVMGLFNDPVNGIDWKVGDETRRLLLLLPKQLERKDLDAFAVAWYKVLLAHFKKTAARGVERNRNISTLLVATRIHGAPYIYRTQIYVDSLETIWSEGEYLIVSPSPSSSMRVVVMTMFRRNSTNHWTHPILYTQASWTRLATKDGGTHPARVRIPSPQL